MKDSVFTRTTLFAGLAGTLLMGANAHGAEHTLGDAIRGGEASGNVRLRFEQVEQDNALDDAEALTVRTRLGYKTDTFKGLSALLEFEDSRTVAGINDYNDTQGNNPGTSVIADPETTEVDQAFIQYQMDMLTAKLGRQVIVYDNHRFIGHVGWRQDRQTFDALRLTYSPLAELSVDYAYLGQRNRIFAEAGDVNSKDHLLNASYKLPVGQLTGYGYFLEVDSAADNSLDTVGVRFAGQQALEAVTLSYALEYATQESDSGAGDFDADYYKVKGGVGVKGITVELAYEVLGSDDGNYGFSTPLATLHAHNGWADQFLGTPGVGLVDAQVAVKGGLAGGQWAIVYHDYEADDASATVDDLGSEVDVAYNRPFAKHYKAGIKYAAYSAGDSAAGKVDTDKLWLTLEASF